MRALIYLVEFEYHLLHDLVATHLITISHTLGSAWETDWTKRSSATFNKRSSTEAFIGLA
jgi:Flp pilus assembly pilin Flp